MSKAYYHILIYSLFFFCCKGTAFISSYQILLLHNSISLYHLVKKALHLRIAPRKTAKIVVTIAILVCFFLVFSFQLLM